jgi:hypothetical protein
MLMSSAVLTKVKVINCKAVLTRYCRDNDPSVLRKEETQKYLSEPYASLYEA